MGYIEDMRRLVGQEPILMVGATVFLLDDRDRLLMLLRTDNHAWGVPGGAVEPGETVESAARRETLEETSLPLTSLSLFGVFSGPEMYYRYPNGDQVHNISIVFLARYDGASLRLKPDEHSAWRFFDLLSLPVPISPPLLPAIRRLQETLAED